MKSLWMLTAMFAVGSVLGAFYFMTLWQTVRRLSRSQNRMRLMLTGYVLRLTITLAAFYFIIQTGYWERLAAAMLGFVLMRVMITHYVAPKQPVEEIVK